MTLQRHSGRLRTIVLHTILAVGMSAVGLFGHYPNLSLADEPTNVHVLPATFKSWPSGTVTHITEQAIEVDRVSYHFKQGVVVMGDDGGTVDLKTLRGTFRVYYHLKDQQVDWLVVELLR